jgi:hypothetical protein
MSIYKSPLHVAALKRCASNPVILQLDVASVFVLVGALQMSLRNGQVSTAPPDVKEIVIGFIRDAREQISQGEPLVADLIDAGFIGIQG